VAAVGGIEMNYGGELPSNSRVESAGISMAGCLEDLENVR